MPSIVMAAFQFFATLQIAEVGNDIEPHVAHMLLPFPQAQDVDSCSCRVDDIDPFQIRVRHIIVGVLQRLQIIERVVLMVFRLRVRILSLVFAQQAATDAVRLSCHLPAVLAGLRPLR